MLSAAQPVKDVGVYQARLRCVIWEVEDPVFLESDPYQSSMSLLFMEVHELLTLGFFFCLSRSAVSTRTVTTQGSAFRRSTSVNTVVI